MRDGFVCSLCHERSTLRTIISGDTGGQRYEIYECASCGHIDMRQSARPIGHGRALPVQVESRPH
jgi:hypothetical protein